MHQPDGEMWNFKMDDPVRKLPDCLMVNLGQSLSIDMLGKDYKTLASMVGHQWDASRYAVGPNPGYELLKVWRTGPNVTIRILMDYLKRLERDDLVAELKEALKDPCWLVVVVKHGDNRTLQLSLDAKGHTTLGDNLRQPLYDKLRVRLDEVYLENNRSDTSWKRDKCSKYKGQQVTLQVRSTAGQSPRVADAADSTLPARRTSPTVTTRPHDQRQPQRDRQRDTQFQNDQQDSSTQSSSSASGSFNFRSDGGSFHCNPTAALTHVETDLPSSLPVDSGPPPVPPPRIPGPAGTHNQLPVTSPSIRSLPDLQRPTDGGQGDPHQYLQLWSQDDRNIPERVQPVGASLDDTQIKSRVSTENMPKMCEKIPGYYADVVGHKQAEKKLQPFLKKDGSYLLRPASKTLQGVTVSVVYKRNVYHYHLYHQQEAPREFYFHQGEKQASTVTALLDHYKKFPLQLKTNAHGKGPTLTKPV